MNGAWGDLVVVQVLRRLAPTRSGTPGAGASGRRRRRGNGWFARWQRAVVRSLRWRGARGRQTPEYRAFMRSPAWAAQRARVLRRDGHVCRDCHRARAREAHHTVYPPTGAPVAAFAALPDATIVAVCEPCHVRRHR
jgi:5-methylcytosine-specific restriction endonuclease McrA